jgi:hypothetical protein
MRVQEYSVPVVSIASQRTSSVQQWGQMGFGGKLALLQLVQRVTWNMPCNRPVQNGAVNAVTRGG